MIIAEVMGIVEKGALKLNGELPFPDRTRVKLTVEAIEAGNPRLDAWDRMIALFDAKPIVGDGKPFDREELYDRD